MGSSIVVLTIGIAVSITLLISYFTAVVRNGDQQFAYTLWSIRILKANKIVERKELKQILKKNSFQFQLIIFYLIEFTVYLSDQHWSITFQPTLITFYFCFFFFSILLLISNYQTTSKVSVFCFILNCLCSWSLIYQLTLTGNLSS